MGQLNRPLAAGQPGSQQQQPMSPRLESAQSEVARPEVTRPESVQPESVQPESAQPGVARPEFAQPGPAKPEFAQPWSVQPESAQPPGESQPGASQLPHASAAWTQQPGPAVGHQEATAPLSRPGRPPLEAPQMGQLNRPPTAMPGDAGSEPSGLPAAPAQPATRQPTHQPGAFSPDRPPSGMSGLPGTPAPAEGLAKPSGLHGLTGLAPTTPSGLGSAPIRSAPAQSENAEATQEPSGLPRGPQPEQPLVARWSDDPDQG
jgi:hypothetical protein